MNVANKALLYPSIGTAVGSDVMTNEKISELFPEWDSEKIFQKIGIKARHVCSKNENSLTLALKACEDLKNKIGDFNIDLLLYVSNSSQKKAPGDGHLFLKSQTKFSNAGCIDINLGCSGYTYALGIAGSLIESGSATKILLITTDQYSKYIKEIDKGNMSLFGDAASASLIYSDSENTSLLGNGFELHDFKFGSYPSGYEDLYIQNSERAELYMNGKEIFNFTANNVIQFIKDQNKDFSNMQVIFHQANSFMLRYMQKKLSIPNENFIMYMSKTGNTVSSSIPLALNNIFNCDKYKNNIFLCGFGIGASYSSIELTLQNK